MNKKDFLWGLLVLSPAVLAVDPQGSAMGNGVTLYPSVDTSVSHSDNQYLQPDDTKESGTVFRVHPMLDLVVDQGDTQISAGVDAEKGLYQKDNNDNYTDFGVYAGVSHVLTSHHQLSAGASYDKGHDARGEGTAKGADALLVLPDEYKESNLNLGYGFGSDGAFSNISLSTSVYKKDYTNNEDITDDREFSRVNYGALFAFDVSSATDLLLDVRLSSLDYTNDSEAALSREADILTVLAGASWDITGKTTGSAKVGVTKRDFNQDDVDDDTSVSWEADIAWDPAEHSTLTLFTAMLSNETTGSGNAIDSSYSLASYQHEFSVFYQLKADISYAKDDYVNDPRSDKTVYYGVTGIYSPLRTVDVTASVTQSSKTSYNSGADLDYDETLFSVGVLYAM